VPALPIRTTAAGAAVSAPVSFTMLLVSRTFDQPGGVIFRTFDQGLGRVFQKL
jgi:hypothetical protein